MKTKLFAGIAVLTTAIAVVPQAYADSTLELISGSTTKVVSGTDGYANFTGSIGGWTVSVDTGLASPADGGTANSIDANSIDYSSSGTASPLYIYYSATGYSGGAAVATIGGTETGVNVSFATYYGSSLLSEANSLTTSPTYYGPAFSGTQDGSVPAGGPYALTEELTVSTGAPNANISFDAGVTMAGVPDGGSTMLLLGASLVGLTVIRSKSAKAR